MTYDKVELYEVYADNRPRRLMNTIDCGSSFTGLKKSHTPLEAAQWLANGWRRAGPRPDSKYVALCYGRNSVEERNL